MTAHEKLNIPYSTLAGWFREGKEGYAYADETDKDRETRRKKNIKMEHTKAVIIHGKYYPSIAIASRELNISSQLIIYRIKTGKSGYSYYEEKNDKIKMD